MLLARVTQVKRKGGVRYVGIDAGMNSLIRPALYEAWHEIVNLTRLDEAARRARADRRADLRIAATCSARTGACRRAAKAT